MYNIGRILEKNLNIPVWVNLSFLTIFFKSQGKGYILPILGRKYI